MSGPRTVFISYRRSDSADISGRLFDHLERDLGAGRVFMDVTSIDAGHDFRQEIVRAIDNSSAVLVVIGQHWDVDRLHDHDDLVRAEIETALRGRAAVIPVLVAGAEMPKAAQLPSSVRALSGRNAVRVHSDDFRVSADRLVTLLRRPAAPGGSAQSGSAQAGPLPTPRPPTATPQPPYSTPIRGPGSRVNVVLGWSIGLLVALIGVAGVLSFRISATLLWLLAVIFVVAGILQLVRRYPYWGIALILLGLLVGPGGAYIFA